MARLHFSCVIIKTLFITCILSSEDLRKEFDHLLTKYDIGGGPRGSQQRLSEKNYRYKNFIKFAKIMSDINADPRNTYKTELNIMSVLLPEEKQMYFGRNNSQYLTGRGNSKEFKIKRKKLQTRNFAESRSWRGTLGPVKFQEKCGACWAFAAAASLENCVFMATGKKIPLSEQEYVDCAGKDMPNGCHGGHEFHAFQYSQHNDRIAPEDSLPYRNSFTAGCNYGQRYQNHANALEDAGVQIKGIFGASTNANKGNTADKILMYLLQERVVATGVFAGYPFQGYKEGVLNDRACQFSPNHAVAVIGYGGDGDFSYWLVRNSWGADWGEKGHIRMSRNINQICGLSWSPTFPILRCRRGRVCEGVNPEDVNIEETYEDKHPPEGCFSQPTKGRVLSSKLHSFTKLEYAKESCTLTEYCVGVTKKGNNFHTAWNSKTKPSVEDDYYMMKC